MKCVVVKSDAHPKSSSLPEAFSPLLRKGQLWWPRSGGSRSFLLQTSRSPATLTSAHLSHNPTSPRNFSLVLQKLIAWKTKRDAWPPQRRQRFPRTQRPPHFSTRTALPSRPRSPPGPGCGRRPRTAPCAPVHPPPIPAQRQIHTKAGVQEGS